MSFSHEQISYTGQDITEIPAVYERTADQIATILILLALGAFPASVLISVETDFKYTWQIFAAYLFVVLFLLRPTTFLLCCLLREKTKVIFEFNAEGFICNKKTVKWADIRKIEYTEFGNPFRFYNKRPIKPTPYYITIHCEHITEEKIIKKDELKKTEYETNVTKPFSIKIIGDDVLKVSSQKAVNFIADKFYHYYGALHGVMLKKHYANCYKLAPISQKDVLQTNTLSSAGSSNQLPKVFK